MMNAQTYIKTYSFTMFVFVCQTFNSQTIIQTPKYSIKIIKTTNRFIPGRNEMMRFSEQKQKVSNKKCSCFDRECQKKKYVQTNSKSNINIKTKITINYKYIQLK